MSLEETLGEGATEAFTLAVTFSDDQPSILYGDYVDTPPWIGDVNIEVPDHKPWPGPGVWKLVYVIWSDAQVQIFFKDGVMVWSNGICSQEGGDPGIRLQRLFNQKMLEFLNEYISLQKIDLPNIEAFYNPFLKNGFVIQEVSDSDNIAKLISDNNKIASCINWFESGANPENEPEWRQNV